MYPVIAASETRRFLDVGSHSVTSQGKSWTFPISCDCLHQSSLKVSTTNILIWLQIIPPQFTLRLSNAKMGIKEKGELDDLTRKSCQIPQINMYCYISIQRRIIIMGVAFPYVMMCSPKSLWGDLRFIGMNRIRCFLKIPLYNNLITCFHTKIPQNSYFTEKLQNYQPSIKLNLTNLSQL